MRILYVGPDSGTSRHRLHALRRLGHEADVVEPRPPILRSRAGYRWTNLTGALGVATPVRSHLEREIGTRRYDVALVDGGELLGPGAVRVLKSVARSVVNYNPDNPYVERDGRKWRLFLQALPHYDLVVTPRASSVAPARDAGARRVLGVTFAADEIVHRPPAPPPDKRDEVVFVGTWMPERGPFMLSLLRAGVPLRIFGPRWSRAPEYPLLSGIVTDRYMEDADYVGAIAEARIALALLSRGNRDLHTTRSLEIPAIGTLLSAERTADHAAMYRDGEEAVLWGDAAECARSCMALLAEPARIAALAEAGRRRAMRNGHMNEAVLTQIIASAGLGA